MRVCPINNVKFSNYNNQQKVTRAQNFKSNVPIPTSPYEIFAGSAVFTAIVSGIYYLELKMFDKFEQHEEQQKIQEKSAKQ